MARSMSRLREPKKEESVVYKVDLLRRVRFTAESEGHDYVDALANAIRDFSVEGGSVENEAEELRSFAQLIDEGAIEIRGVYIMEG